MLIAVVMIFVPCLLRCVATETLQLGHKHGQSASLMQVRTIKGITKLPVVHKGTHNRRRTKAQRVRKVANQVWQNSTRASNSIPDAPQHNLELDLSLPAVKPLLPSLTTKDKSVEYLGQPLQPGTLIRPVTEHRHMLWRGIIFLIVSVAFALTAFRAFTMDRKSGLLQVGLLVIILWVMVGLTAFSGEVLPITKHEEGLTMIETVYLCVQILTTVGYGDLTPASPSGRLFVCAYALSALVMVAGLISELADYLVKKASRDLAQGLNSVQDRIESTKGSPPVEGVDEKQKVKPRRRLLKAIFHFAMLVLSGSFFFSMVPGEERTFEEALYMSVVTLSTIGFGDQVAKTEHGRAFASVWMLLGVSAMATMVSEFSEEFLHMRQGWTTEDMTTSLLEEMDTDGDNQVSKLEFLQFTLRRYGLVSKEDFDAILAQFDALDRDQSGFLDAKDLKLFQ
jgi:potassium channel subfamily K